MLCRIDRVRANSSLQDASLADAARAMLDLFEKSPEVLPNPPSFLKAAHEGPLSHARLSMPDERTAPDAFLEGGPLLVNESGVIHVALGLTCPPFGRPRVHHNLVHR
jgi:hypothetical protein